MYYITTENTSNMTVSLACIVKPCCRCSTPEECYSCRWSRRWTVAKWLDRL